MIHLDINKSFNKVPYGILIKMLLKSGLGGKTINQKYFCESRIGYFPVFPAVEYDSFLKKKNLEIPD